MSKIRLLYFLFRHNCSCYKWEEHFVHFEHFVLFVLFMVYLFLVPFIHITDTAGKTELLVIALKREMKASHSSEQLTRFSFSVQAFVHLKIMLYASILTFYYPQQVMR